MHPGQPVDRGEPAAHPDPARDRAVKKLYQLRGAVERENGRLKNEWGFLPLWVRRIERGSAAYRPNHPGPAGGRAR
jgi:hypothetical protein